MPAFYLTNNIHDTSDLQIFEKNFSHSKFIEINDIALHCFYNDNDPALFFSGEDFIFTVGVFIYKGKWGIPALDLFYTDLKNHGNITECLINTKGQFCILCCYNNMLSIISDKTGSIPFYIYQKGALFAVSNIFLPLAKNNKNTLNLHWVAEYLSQDNIKNYKNVIFFERTICNEIDLADSGTIYSVDTPFRKIKYFDIEAEIKIGQNSDKKTVIENVKQILINNLSFLNNDTRILLDITGGFDTRTNLAILLYNNLDFYSGNQIPTEYSHISNKGKYSDLLITNEIKKQFALNFFQFDEKKFESEKEWFFQMAKNLFSLEVGDGYTYPRRLAYYNFVKSTLHRDILISGLYGTELLTDLSFPKTLTGKYEDISPFLHQYYPYLDLIKEPYYSEQMYYENLTAHFKTIFSIIGAQSLKEAGNFLFYVTFFRQKFSRYHGNANIIIPTYSPYIEADFIRLMIQAASDVKTRYLIQRTIISELNPRLGNINTTHGYPATLVTTKNFHRFVRILYAIEANLQYIGPIDRLAEKIYNVIAGYVKKKSWARNAGIKIQQTLYGSEKSPASAISPFEMSIKIIETSFDSMPVFKIIDYAKFRLAIKKDDTIVNKIMHLNELLTEINFIT